MRVALLSYSGKPLCGGQGVYVRHLSRELAALGHSVEVIGAQPYPVLDAGRPAHRAAQPRPLPPARPVPHPAAGEYRDWIDLLEVATMWTGGFPEPLTFSLRAGAGCCASGAASSTSCTTTRPSATACSTSSAAAAAGHDHPPPHHRRPAAGPGRGDGLAPRAPCAAGTASRACRGGSPAGCRSVLDRLRSSAREIVDDFGVRPDRIHVVHIGADTGLRAARPCRGCPAASSRRPAPTSRSRAWSTWSRRWPRCAPSATASCSWSSSAQARRPRPSSDRAARPRGRRRVRQGHQRRRTARPGRAARDRLRAVALRGLLAARRRGHGHRHPAGRQPRRRDPRGRGPDGECADLVDRPATRRARRGARPAARRPGAPGPPRRGRPRSGCWPTSPGAPVAEATAAAYREAIAPGRPAPRRTRRRRADRRLHRLPAAPGRPRARPGLRRRPARLRVYRRGARGGRPRPERRGDPRGRQVVRRDEGGRRGARGRRGRQHGGRRARPALPRRRVRRRDHLRGHGAHPRRQGRSPRWCACCGPAAGSP